MDDLKRMAVFATVVELGSMSAAARRLGLSPSAVSQQVRALELQGGVTLLHRSTRQLSTTDAGARFAAHCQALVSAAAAARAQLAMAHDAPSGELRLSAPVGFARHVAPALAPLLAQHAGLNLRLLVDDAMIDLIEARVDLALRAGRLPDSSWVARRLCDFEWALCAAPSHVREHGMPRQPSDLLGHRWMVGSRDATAQRLDLTGPGGETESVRIEARIASNNQLTLQQLCVQGLGAALMVVPDVAEDLATGRLVRLLPDWRLPPGPIWAVTPQRRQQPAKVRHAIAALEQHLGTLTGALR